MAEYDAAKGASGADHEQGNQLPGTWRWLCVRYFAECADYLRLMTERDTSAGGFWKHLR